LVSAIGQALLVYGGETQRIQRALHGTCSST